MDTPISIIPGKRRVRRKRRSAPAAPPATLTLIAATHVPTESITLTFDRAIEVGGLDGNAIVLDDGDVGFRYVATGAVNLLGPNIVQIYLNGIEEFVGPGVHLTAAPSNGIVAADDLEMAWAGVSDLELPFP